MPEEAAGSTLGEIYDGKRRILLVGESHTSTEAKKELANSLGALKSKGVTDLTLEWPHDWQKKVDDYRAGKISRDEMVAFVKKGYAPHEATQPGISEGFVNMLDEYRKQGQKVHCMDATEAER